MSGYEVGQRVWIYGVNRRGGPAEGTVVKVGRTLIHIKESDWGSPTQYRIETGVINDTYQHHHIKTDAKRVEHERLAAVFARWKAHGISSGYGQPFPVEVMERVADVLDQSASEEIQ